MQKQREEEILLGIGTSSAGSTTKPNQQWLETSWKTPEGRADTRKSIDEQWPDLPKSKMMEENLEQITPNTDEDAKDGHAEEAHNKTKILQKQLWRSRGQLYSQLIDWQHEV